MGLTWRLTKTKGNVGWNLIDRRYGDSILLYSRWIQSALILLSQKMTEIGDKLSTTQQGGDWGLLNSCRYR